MDIAIVNESDHCATLLHQIIGSQSDHSISWVANSADDALDKISSQPVDLVIMGLVSPTRNGLDMTQEIMKSYPCAILIVTSDVDENANLIFSAMTNGALDVIQSPVNDNTCSNRELFTEELLGKFTLVERLIKSNDRNKAIQTQQQKESGSVCPLVCIGASTGGPGSLITLLKGIPEDTKATYVIVQHVDKNFITGLAEWLDNSISLPVLVAEKNKNPKPGHVYIAGGDEHLLINNKLEFEYTPDPIDYSYRPSIDIFFKSACDNWTGKKIGALLTGMGDDGAQGLLNLKQQGAYTIAQDEETCAVFGMPRAAIKLNAVSIVLPIQSIGSCITRRLIQSDKNPVDHNASII